MSHEPLTKRHWSKPVVIAFLFVAIVVDSLVSNTLINTFHINTGFALRDGSVESAQLGSADQVNILFNLLLLAPILETVLFQNFLQVLVSRFIRKQRITILLVASAFSLWHILNVWNAIFAFSSGLIFATIFSVFDDRKGKGTLAVVVAHFLSNMLTLSFPLFFDIVQLLLPNWGQM